MMKGYLTTFLALSLSIFIGFILLLTQGALRNGEKVRLECAVNTAMNATLGEYHIGLFETYDLLYVDTSYLVHAPCKEHLAERLRYYIKGNLQIPWGWISLDNVEITALETAAADFGSSMRNQAITYIHDKGENHQWQVLPYIEVLRLLDGGDPLAEWNGLMESIAGMELPKIQNEEGIWEEVPLLNPADAIFSLSGSDIFYLAKVDLKKVSANRVHLENYISHRQPENTGSVNRTYIQDENAYLNYLSEKFGNFHNPASESLLSCQLEYIVCGKASDRENVYEVGKRLFRMRFTDNVSCAFSDGHLRAEAELLVDTLQAVQLNPTFREPVVKSILYACAFLETVNDIRNLYHGKTVPITKSSHNMSIESVLSGTTYEGDGGEGLSYQEYLAGMLLLLDEKQLNLKVMDLMEMEMRKRDGNEQFSMDWCVERYEFEVSSKNNFGDMWNMKRKCGYF